jgi:hypothetical protein
VTQRLVAWRSCVEHPLRSFKILIAFDFGRYYLEIVTFSQLLEIVRVSTGLREPCQQSLFHYQLEISRHNKASYAQLYIIDPEHKF